MLLSLGKQEGDQAVIDCDGADAPRRLSAAPVSHDQVDVGEVIGSSLLRARITRRCLFQNSFESA